MHHASFVLLNARIVLADEVVGPGWLEVENGRITEIGLGCTDRAGVDLDGDILIPGLVELHTDHLEPHVTPRPSVDWHPLSAVLAYDAQIAASGITTVFDSLRLGWDDHHSPNALRELDLAQVIHTAQDAGLLRADHLTHLRCEICSPGVVDCLVAFIDALPVHLVSLMDHTPGQRQFRDVEKLRTYYRGKRRMSEADLDAFIAQRRELFDRFSGVHRREIVAVARRHGIRLASHDDTTIEHVRESIADGVSIAEFPTTAEAASASHTAGIAVMMGAPNLVLGGSHSGNVSAESLARAGTLDILSSDYVPASLIQAAFELPRRVPGLSLPAAIATVTTTPARSMGLRDRGIIQAGCRADLVRVHMAGDMPVVRTVWREGCRVS